MANSEGPASIAGEPIIHGDISYPMFLSGAKELLHISTRGGRYFLFGRQLDDRSFHNGQKSGVEADQAPIQLFE